MVRVSLPLARGPRPRARACNLCGREQSFTGLGFVLGLFRTNWRKCASCFLEWCDECRATLAVQALDTPDFVYLCPRCGTELWSPPRTRRLPLKRTSTEPTPSERVA